MTDEPENDADVLHDDSEDWKETLDKAEYERLRTYEKSGRIHETLVDIFDFWTDLALIAVLYIYSKGNDPDARFLQILASSTFTGCGDPFQSEDLFWNLFIASVVVMCISQFIRLLIACHRITLNSKMEDVEAKDRPWLLLGVIITQFSPHNGQLVIDSRFEKSGFQTDVVRYTKVEMFTQVIILFGEDFPQFVIQVLFFSRTETGKLPIGFFLSTIVTILNTLIAIGNIVYLWYKGRALRKQQLKVKMRRVIEAMP
mmetsp:Transcript_16623/g.20528  ORF Transcript_16623/g.20528 Transcript_16623/m.20528 type:complete len:257 (-) Transcript_16623:28-798(-)|eukprot:CAMPEP_0204839942 /NCGR_PEP_ID=MMETSP1346-20131115/35821_1 /ASSEMBLY_ACC=CAM_ASM_000771 /TAXON_ID=215587 /ORGANISM="Aplanochytrium stocchinoi, Strain GSBS06" /LENGTH=256 /DNA_ID=CAMNT_0051977011 /DNA_START=24 /DNA_END=794 /DNA_ORIENTATION=-